MCSCLSLRGKLCPFPMTSAAQHGCCERCPLPIPLQLSMAAARSALCRSRPRGGQGPGQSSGCGSAYTRASPARQLNWYQMVRRSLPPLAPQATLHTVPPFQHGSTTLNVCPQAAQPSPEVTPSSNHPPAHPCQRPSHHHPITITRAPPPPLPTHKKLCAAPASHPPASSPTCRPPAAGE